MRWLPLIPEQPLVAKALHLQDRECVAVEGDGFGAGREDDTQPNFPTGILHAGAEQAGDDGPDAPFPEEVVRLSKKDGRKTKWNYDCIWSNHVQ